MTFITVIHSYTFATWRKTREDSILRTGRIYKQNQFKPMTKETVTLTEIEMVGKDVIAELLLDSNTKVEWIDSDDRNTERVLHMAIPQWKLLDVIDRQLLKRITKKNNESEINNQGGESA